MGATESYEYMSTVTVNKYPSKMEMFYRFDGVVVVALSVALPYWILQLNTQLLSIQVFLLAKRNEKAEINLTGKLQHVIDASKYEENHLKMVMVNGLDSIQL